MFIFLYIYIWIDRLFVLLLLICCYLCLILGQICEQYNILTAQKIIEQEAMGSEYKKLIQNFRVSIRRKQIDSLFQQQRQQFLRDETEQLKQQLHYKLRDQASRQLWLHEIAEQLSATGSPSVEWVQPMKNLYYALSAFKNDHQRWLELGIVSSVCELFNKQYLHLKLSKFAANIIIDMLYLNSNWENYKVIKGVMAIQFIPNLINLLNERAQVQYIRLVAIICDCAPTLRNFIVDQYQIVEFMTQKTNNIINNHISLNMRSSVDNPQCQFKNTEYLNSLLQLQYMILKTHQFDKDTFSRSRKQNVKKCLQVISRLVDYPLNNRNFILVLKAIKQICLLEKQDIYDNIFEQYLRLLDKVMELLVYQPKQDIRLLSIHILCNFILSGNAEHTAYLLNRNILDKVQECYMMDGLLNFLVNLTADDWNFQHTVMHHPIMAQIVIPESTDSFNQNIRRETVYILCSMLVAIPRNTHQVQDIYLLMNEYKIMDILISNIANNPTNAQLVQQILNSFKQAILDEHKQRHNNSQSERRQGRQAVNFYKLLKQHYRIQNIVEQLVQMEDTAAEFMGFFIDLDVQS